MRNRVTKLVVDLQLLPVLPHLQVLQGDEVEGLLSIRCMRDDRGIQLHVLNASAALPRGGNRDSLLKVDNGGCYLVDRLQIALVVC